MQSHQGLFMPQFPTLAPSSLSMGSQSNNYISKSIGGVRQARRSGTTLLTFDASFSKLTRAQAAQLWGFIQAQNGQFGVFDFAPPLLKDSLSSSAPATATVNTAAAARQSTVILGGFVANKTVLNAGDLIRFANHAKAYVVARDAVSNASGVATINLAFDLIRPLPVATVAGLKNVLVQCSLVDNEQNQSISAPFFHSLTVKLIESI
ncbi:hypothetical protein [Deefgea piscis]|uniref:hypothetical protein n=1 Tax=Deefgea piscis TaxID=2739061 RepID=UPI001C7E4F66|nr:hypothetical protein [Deefgea piscis]QZA80865.1 hypothetical protein K4H25_15445 [Deefgea piscis]